MATEFTTKQRLQELNTTPVQPQQASGTAKITLPPIPPKQTLHVRTKEEQAQASETAHVKLPPLPEKLPTSSVMEYIVYEYLFPNGKIYIGRTRSDLSRLGDWESYSSQYVYKKMKKYEGKIEIKVVYKTTNIFYAFAVEHKLIDIHYNHSYNANREIDWFNKALIYIAYHTSYTPEEVADMLNEYLKHSLIIPIPTKHTVLIK